MVKLLKLEGVLSNWLLLQNLLRLAANAILWIGTVIVFFALSAKNVMRGHLRNVFSKKFEMSIYLFTKQNFNYDETYNCRQLGQ